MIDIDNLRDAKEARDYFDKTRRVGRWVKLEQAHAAKAFEARFSVWDRCPPGALAPVPCRPLPWWRRLINELRDAT